MTLDFVQENFTIGQKNPDLSPQFIFYRKGFRIGGKATPDWREVTLSGVGALTLTNALANSLLSLKLFGNTEQNGTPTPEVAMDIVCNNGVVKVSRNLFNADVVLGGTLDNSQQGIDGRPNPKRARLEYTFLKAGTYTLSNTDNIEKQVLYCSYANADGSGFIDASIPWNWDKTLPYTFTITSDRYMRFMVKNDDNSDFTNDNIGKFQIEQGSTATPYMPYGQIYVDGTTETVEITGKNLFDTNQQFANGYIDENGNLVDFEDLKTTVNYIPVLPNTDYTVSFTALQTVYSNFNISTWTSNGTIIDRPVRSTITSTGQKIYTFTTTATTAKIKVTIWSDPSVLTNFQIEQGSTATTYEPYTVLGTATAENLFNVGDYQDVQSVIDGGVTKNVGIKVLNGAENWVYLPSGDSTRFYTSIDTINNLGLRLTPLYNTHFLCVSDGRPVAQVPNNAIYTGGGSNQVFIQTNDCGTTVAEFKQFLADQYANGTPVIIAYPLATATTETVTGQPMNIQAGTNIVQITQASIDNLGLEVSYKAIV